MLRITLFTLLLHIVFLSTPTTAFFPNAYRTLAGIGGINHRLMTKDALDVIYSDLGITAPSGTMNKAREEIQDANEETDSKEAKNSSAHFDGEQFAGGQARLKTLYQGILDDMKD